MRWSSTVRLCLVLSSLRCLFEDSNSYRYEFSFSMFSSSTIRASMASLVSGFAGGGCTGLVKYTFGSTPGLRGSGLYVETSLSEASSRLAGSIACRDMARLGFFSIRAVGVCFGWLLAGPHCCPFCCISIKVSLPNTLGKCAITWVCESDTMYPVRSRRAYRVMSNAQPC
jgi:hypothetical protein